MSVNRITKSMKNDEEGTIVLLTTSTRSHTMPLVAQYRSSAASKCSPIK